MSSNEETREAVESLSSTPDPFARRGSFVFTTSTHRYTIELPQSISIRALAGYLRLFAGSQMTCEYVFKQIMGVLSEGSDLLSAKESAEYSRVKPNAKTMQKKRATSRCIKTIMAALAGQTASNLYDFGSAQAQLELLNDSIDPDSSHKSVAKVICESKLPFSKAHDIILEDYLFINNNMKEMGQGEEDLMVEEKLKKLLQLSHDLAYSLNSILPMVDCFFDSGTDSVRAGWRKEVGFNSRKGWKMNKASGRFEGVEATVLYENDLEPSGGPPGGYGSSGSRDIGANDMFYVNINHLLDLSATDTTEPPELRQLCNDELCALENAHLLCRELFSLDIDEKSVLSNHAWVESTGDKLWRSVFVQSSLMRLWKSIAIADEPIWRQVFDKVKGNRNALGLQTGAVLSNEVRSAVLHQVLRPVQFLDILSTRNWELIREEGAHSFRQCI